MTDQLVNEKEINQILAIVNLLTMIRSCFFLHNWIIETDSDGEKEGMCPVVVLKQVCDWDNLHSRPHRKVLDQTQSHHQALN
ncbi:hypothetical protein NP493_6171g00000 [Ridgeia piscesae]|uniref:Uncharacterized protein n=1 Tax=Ridgeia piscesae TaxID=27915 RepID=A0AAD9MNG4_RIDPI|nr:hypothetical protein NP493_6171g00000 [Ridgeia piscesae]